MLDLTGDEVSIILQLLNGVQGLENARIVLPLYDKFKIALVSINDLSLSNKKDKEE